MRTNFYFQSAGPNEGSTANPDYPRETSEHEEHGASSTDDQSSSHGVKIESPSSGTSLSQYDSAVGRSSISSERYSAGVDRVTTIYQNDPSPSSLPYRHSVSSPREQKYLPESEDSSQKSPASTDARSTGLARSRTRHHLQPEVWERHKEEIHDLYIGENKSLNELMEIMQGKGFVATPRMYKAKFAQWGFVKNNKKKDVAMMVRLQRERGAVGKPTAFRRHGRSVDIETYMRRKGISTRDLDAPVADADLPEYLRALTPPPAEPEHMTLPSHLHAQELVVSCFKDLTLGWRDSMTSPASFEGDFDIYFDGELCEATRDFSRACWFFSKSHTSLGALLSQRAFSSLHLVIKTPSALGLFDLLIASVISPDHGLAKELWKYLAGYAEATMGPSNTLCRLFKSLDEVFRNDSLETGVDFIFSCMESIIGMLLETNEFTQTVVPSLSFFLLGDLILFNSTRTNLPSLQRAAASTSTIVSSQDSAQDDRRSFGVMKLIEPAAHLWQNGPRDELSIQLAYAFLQLADEVTSRYNWSYWVAWRVIAHFHRSKCGEDESSVKDNPRHALARYALEKAIDTAEAGRGFGETQIFENMQTLEEWHREARDATQELAVRRRREKGLRDYFETLQRSRGVEMSKTPTSQ
ncbi:uncharacterized protein F4822DRAFT_328748 [Hypoxylon trugodes]|uniref:uncharacterized protein n=1 Tax=Hypoxylon trugodes TaxID=326681 RepID=UPI00219CFB6C|nr:uncharacterized protein F4822DRAFT_328748 [Hypoxylon trugodes]KAI1386884.1 hypothetical protein F4822DRAFT_328748 [Hypoxylon trugodes]